MSMTHRNILRSQSLVRGAVKILIVDVILHYIVARFGFSGLMPEVVSFRPHAHYHSSHLHLKAGRSVHLLCITNTYVPRVPSVSVSTAIHVYHVYQGIQCLFFPRESWKPLVWASKHKKTQLSYLKVLLDFLNQFDESCRNPGTMSCALYRCTTSSV